MAFSYQEEIATSGQTDILINIAYFDEVDIHLLVDNVYKPFTWLSRTKIKVQTPFVGSERIRVIRKTDESRLRVLFSEGAAFTRVNLDEVNTQLLYLAQEAVEGNRLTDFFFSFDMHGNRITSLGDPINPKDAVNKEYVDSGDKYLQDQIDVLDDRVEFIANHPIIDGEARAFRFVATTPETSTVPTGLVFSTCTVWLNGVKLTAGYDYTVSVIGTITLLNHSMYPDDEITAYLGGIMKPMDENTYVTIQHYNAGVADLQSQINTNKEQATQDVVELGNQLNTTGGELTALINVHTTDISNIKVDVQQIHTSTDSMRTSITSNTSGIETLSTTTSTLNSAVSSLNTRVTALEGGIV